jgi:hypothetical protein
MKRLTALGSCIGLAAGSFALMPSAVAAAPTSAAIVHQASAVGPAGAGELTVSFPLAQTAAQRELTRTLAGQRSSHGRAASFAQSQPSAAHRDAVQQWAAAHGFRVVHSSRFLVSVSGPSAALAAALGTTVKRQGRYTVPASAPVVPAELAQHAATAVGLDDRPRYRHHSAPYGPSDVRTIGNHPVRDATAGAGVTVGTVNFAPWVKSDLDAWAADPEADQDDSKTISIAPGQITEVPLGGFDTVGDGMDPASGEVDLDAEAILGAAPAAKQRLYFADNTTAGSLAIWDEMASDAAQGRLHVASTSWGACEPSIPTSELNAEVAAINTLVAAGVTLFAASGDAGAYDCSVNDPDGFGVDNSLAVDFPASSPNVVAVGGTSTDQPDELSDVYTHVAWGPAVNDTTPSAFYQGDGSGGGFSSRFSRPAWQPASATPGRQVPDIAGLADPDTGYIGYLTSDWDDNGSPYGDYSLLGGTSLAAPLAAAGLASVIGATSSVTKMGNILPTLYCRTSATHDVNGRTGFFNKPSDYSGNGYYSATPGFDHVTGLGVVDWTAFGAGTISDPPFGLPSTVRSTTVPVTAGGCQSDFTSWGIAEGTSATCAGNNLSSPPTSATIAATQGTHTITLTALDIKGVCHTVTNTVLLDSVAPMIGGFQATYNGISTPRFMITWALSDAAPSSGLHKTHLVLRDNTLGKIVYQWDGGGSSSNHVTLNGVPGHSYTVTNVGYDRAGNVSATATKAYTMPRDDKSFAFSGFVRQNNSQDFMGSHALASKAGAYARLTFTAKTAWVGVIKSPSGGYLDVYVDGVRKGRVSLYANSTRFRQQLKVAAFATRGAHTVVLKAVGAHQAGAIGNNVWVDSLTVAY